MPEQRFPLDEEQISDGINPFSGLGGLIDLGATFHIDQFGAEKEFSNIKKRESYFSSCGEKNLWPFSEKDE
jgi:hypothetical protein